MYAHRVFIVLLSVVCMYIECSFVVCLYIHCLVSSLPLLLSVLVRCVLLNRSIAPTTEFEVDEEEDELSDSDGASVN